MLAAPSPPPINSYPQHHLFLLSLQSRNVLAQKELWFCQHPRDYYISHSWLLRNVTNHTAADFQGLLERKGKEHNWKRLDMPNFVPHLRLPITNASDKLGFCLFPKHLQTDALVLNKPHCKKKRVTGINWEHACFFPSACDPSPSHTFHTLREHLLYARHWVSGSLEDMVHSLMEITQSGGEDKQRLTRHFLSSALLCPMRLWTIFPLT